MNITGIQYAVKDSGGEDHACDMCGKARAGYMVFWESSLDSGKIVAQLRVFYCRAASCGRSAIRHAKKTRREFWRDVDKAGTEEAQAAALRGSAGG